MAITIHILYEGKEGNAEKFAREMIVSGTVEAIRKEQGNLRYEYFRPFDNEGILLIDSWEDQEALDMHHSSPMMKTIMSLREKYDLRMTVERYLSADAPPSDNKYIKK